jgi:hypothetical protein
MEKSYIGRCGFLIALVVMMNAAMVWGQSNDAATADGPLREEMIADIKDLSAGCSTFVRPEYRYRNDINKQRPPTNGILVAEDMRCRQCRGKCTAENLRCRSQCSGDSACLAQCEERSSRCETICKQIFQCE